MNSPNPKVRTRPSLFSMVMVLTLLCSSIFVMLPVLQAAGDTPGEGVQFAAHDHSSHQHAATQEDAGPVVVDFGGVTGAPIAGLEQWQAQQGELVQPAAVDADVLGPKRVMVLRVYFNDYANASRYSKPQVEGLFGQLDQLWRNTSYNKINIEARVSELFKLPSNRSAYIDDFDDGDLSNGGKYMKVLDDAVANSPAGLDWSNLDAVMVVMAETNASQFHRGQANKCTLKMGPSGSNKLVGCAIFSENPSDSDVNVWGRWAHEIGHAFQDGGPAHPSNYSNEFELMDSNYPGQTGAFEKQSHTGFPGWLPPAKYLEVMAGPNSSGETVCLRAIEYDPAGQPTAQAFKVKISNSLYYMVSVRRKVLGDDLNGQFNGIPDEGVLIERVNEGGDPWVTVKGPGGDRNKLWKEGQTYEDAGDGVFLFVTKKVDDDQYCVTLRFSKGSNQPDVALYPWLSAPGNTWETTDIWVDSPVNGYGTYRYGSWNDLSGNAVPRGNGDDPAVGLTNRLYARVRNWGSATATNVVVNWEVTDPLGVGIAGANGWALIGTVDKNTFPSLAAIAPGAFVDVYVDWTPNVNLTPEQIAAGVFAFHSCVRVKINPVAGETALANQNGDREQENISYFEATTAGGGAPIYKDVIRLRNDDKVNKKFFYLSYKSDLPAAWSLDINGGELGIELNPDELREIPVIIKPQGPAVVGSIFGVDVSASSQRELVSDLDPKDTHLEFDPLGGVRVEARVLEATKIDCSAEDFGEIVVKGTLGSENFAKFYDEKNPPRVLVQGIDDKGNAIRGGIASTVAGVQPDGKFNATIYSRQPDIKAVLCLFAGTDKLASSSSGYQPVPNPNDPKACGELVSPTQIPGAGLIHFDDLSDASVIGTNYLASHGVDFEVSRTNQAISYDQSLHPTESTLPHSRPSYAINNAISPNTSNGVPMTIKFDKPKTHVGFYMGNGVEVVTAAGLTGVMTAYDAAGAVICQVSNSPVPDSVKEFIGVQDPAGRIASVTLDYGKTAISETIDDLYFAPHTPVVTPTATPTPVGPTPTPTHTPGPTATNTPVVATNPVVAAPYLPVQKFVIESILIQKDLSIHGLEITQGVQCFDTSKGLAGCADNSLPVIAKKDATARIYLKYNSPIFVGGSMNNVPVRLHIFANGVEYIANASGKATTGINQGNSDSADVYFNVNFSNDVNVSFYAEVDPNNAIVETNEGNNRYPASGTINLTFRKSKTLDVVGTRLRYHPAGYGGQQYAGGWAVNGGAADWLEQVLPLRNNGINYSLSSGYLNWTGSLGGGDGQHDLIRYLNTSYILQNAFGWLFGNGPYTGAEHVYGWAPNAGYSGGHADMPIYPHAGGLGKVGIGTDRTSDGNNSTDDPGGGALIFGHELVHDYNVLHTDTADACGSSDDNSDFPYGSSSIQEYGFNPITGKIYDPAVTHDLMSYCPAGGSKEGWIAPFTWSKMAGKLDAAIVAAASAHGTQANSGFLTSAAAQSLVVNATVYNPAAPGFDASKPGKLGDLYLVDIGVEYPVAVGNYAIQLRKGEEVLATKAFSLSFESEYSAHTGEAHDEQPGDPADLTKADISFILPWVDGTNTIVLVKDGAVLDSRQISANKPAVTVTSPNADVEWPAGSTQTLTWQGSDADGDALRYTVFFSADGGVNWDIMATELTTPSLEIEVDAMAGTTGGKFRIVATDGVNIGQADSATVKIPNKAPTAAISDPVNGKSFIPGQLVVLQGAALDLEDGRLGDDALKWASDKQGVLGSGPSLPVNNLQPGEHLITLSVVDSQGLPANATTKILVGYQIYLPSISK